MRMRVAVVGALFVLCAATFTVAQNGNDLFQQALVRQTASGDIQGAIQIYERIVREFSSNRALVARALVQLGKCYESLGEARSREYYEQVVGKYADQTDTVAEARNRLTAAAATVTPIATPPTEDPFSFALSPDGRSVVFSVANAFRGQLWLHDLATGKSAPIPGADLVPSASPLNRAAPFWSPDGKFIAYFSDRKLKRISVAGGTAQTLADAPSPAGGTWNNNGIIVFSISDEGLVRVSADGSGPAVRLPIQAAECPIFLPDGERFLFYRRRREAAASQSTQVLWLGSLNNDKVTPLPVQTFAATFAAPDQLLFATEQGLFVQRLDMQKLILTGTASRVTEKVDVLPPQCVLAASGSPSGNLAFRTAHTTEERQMVWMDREGRDIGSFLPDSATCCARISPDGSTIAFGRNGIAPAGSLWVVGSTPGSEAHPGMAGSKAGVWSPTGEFVALSMFNPGLGGPFMGVVGLNGIPILELAKRLETDPKSVTALSKGRPLARRLRNQRGEKPLDWSKDGRFILYEEIFSRDLLVLPLTETAPVAVGEPIPVARTSAAEQDGRFSPDGKWIAYQSDEAGGRPEIFLQSFPGATASRFRVSLDGGTSPRWDDSGNRLYFLSPDFKVMVVSIQLSKAGGGVEIGSPVPLFRNALPVGSEIEVSADGERLLVNRPVKPADAAPITVLSTWTRAR